MIEVVVTAGLASLARLDAGWTRVLPTLRSRAYYHMPQWYAAYLRALEPTPDRVHLVEVHDHGHPIAVLPLRHSTRSVFGARIRILELPRHPHLHLSDAIIPPPLQTRRFLDSIVRRMRASSLPTWDLLSLRPVPAGAAAEVVSRGLPPRYGVHRRINDCFVTDFGQASQDFEQRLTKKFRANLRNARNRIASLNPVSIDAAESPAALTTAYAAFTELEASGWKGQEGAGTAIALDDRLDAFYRTLIESSGPTFGCRIHVLRAGGPPLAAAFSILVDRTLYVLKIAYSESHAYYSPGHMLVDGLSRRLISESSVDSINWVSGAPWVRVWATRSEPVFSTEVFGTTLLGVVMAAASALPTWRSGFSMAARRLAQQRRKGKTVDVDAHGA